MSEKIRPPAAKGSAPLPVIRLDTIKVEGKIRKPEAFYVMPRSNLNFDDLSKTPSFLPKVLQSVDQLLKDD